MGKVAIGASLVFTLVCASAWGQTPCDLDIDGDGRFDQRTDALLFTRLAAGFRGEALINQATHAFSARKTYEDIAGHLVTNCNLASQFLYSSNLSAYPQSITITQGDERAMKLSYHTKVPFTSAAVLRVTPPAGFTATAVKQPLGVWNVEVKTPNTLALTTYEVPVRAELCADASCASVIANSLASTIIKVSVTRPSWVQRRGNDQQTGYAPISFSSVNFTELWNWSTVPVSTIHGFSASNGLIVVANQQSYTNGVVALREQSGFEQWSKPGYFAFPSPLISGDRAYAATSVGNGTFGKALNLSDGTEIWTTDQTINFSSAYQANNSVIFSSYGSFWAFDAASGAFKWSSSFSTGSQPSSVLTSNALLFPTSIGTITGISPEDGSVQFTLNDPLVSGHSDLMLIDGASIISRTTNGPIARYAIANGLPLWRSEGSYQGRFAFANGQIFASTARGGMDVLDAVTGRLIWQWEPTTIQSQCTESEIVVTDTHAFLSTTTNTYAINLATRAKDWETTRSGRIGITGGRTLLIHGPCYDPYSSAWTTISAFRVIQ